MEGLEELTSLWYVKIPKTSVLLENNNKYFHVLEFKVTVIVVPFQEHGQDLREMPIAKIRGFSRFLWKKKSILELPIMHVRR